MKRTRALILGCCATLIAASWHHAPGAFADEPSARPRGEADVRKDALRVIDLLAGHWKSLKAQNKETEDELANLRQEIDEPKGGRTGAAPRPGPESEDSKADASPGQELIDILAEHSKAQKKWIEESEAGLAKARKVLSRLNRKR